MSRRMSFIPAPASGSAARRQSLAGPGEVPGGDLRRMSLAGPSAGLKRKAPPLPPSGALRTLQKPKCG